MRSRSIVRHDRRARSDGRSRLEAPKRSSSARPPREALTAAAVLDLQQAAGNAAVARMLDARQPARAEVALRSAPPRPGPDGSYVVLRHASSTDTPDASDPVVYPGLGSGPRPDLDHESQALRHELSGIYWSAVVRPGGRAGKDVDAKWVTTQFTNPHAKKPLSGTWLGTHVHQSQVHALVAYLNGPQKTWQDRFWGQTAIKQPGNWVAAISRLETLGETEEARRLAAAIRSFDFSPGRTGPPTSLKPSALEARSGALWSGDKGEILVSRGLVDPVEILAAILFECGNAKRAKKFADVRSAEDPKIRGFETALAAAKVKGDSTRVFENRGKLANAEKAKSLGIATIEFETDRENQAKMRAAYGVDTQAALCAQLGVSADLLVPATYVEDKPVPLPDRRVLRRQEARNALWWFFVDAWPLEQQRAIWLATNHGELFGATAHQYG